MTNARVEAAGTAVAIDNGSTGDIVPTPILPAAPRLPEESTLNLAVLVICKSIKSPVNDDGFAPIYVPLAAPPESIVFERLTNARDVEGATAIPIENASSGVAAPIPKLP